MWAENDECLAWLDGHCAGSVLFVSFGSIAQLSAPQMAELERGLEAAAHPVLIVVREIDVFPEGLTRLSDVGHFLAVKWAPQLRVLGHLAIGGFLTHCGWNSTLEAMCKGVPMLAWPVVGDQMLNCRLVGWLVS
jgi:UDP:flavonoid glycosyltransferase YjiC (YdhE family)